MRYTALLLVIGFSTPALAQTVTFGNFKIADQEIIYQKVFTQDSISAAKLEKYFKELPYVANVQAAEGGIEFDVNDITIDYKKYQFSQVGTPPIMQTGKYSGKVSIGTREGKYRVTMRSIMVTGDMGYKKVTEKQRLTDFACKNSGTILSQDWCRPNMLGLLDQVLTDKLQFVGKDDGEW